MNTHMSAHDIRKMLVHHRMPKDLVGGIGKEKVKSEEISEKEEVGPAVDPEEASIH